MTRSRNPKKKESLISKSKDSISKMMISTNEMIKLTTEMKNKVHEAEENEINSSFIPKRKLKFFCCF